MVEEYKLDTLMDVEGADVDLDRIYVFHDPFEISFTLEFDGIEIFTVSTRPPCLPASA